MMDKSSSVTAAFAAGKLPSQQQFSKAVDHSLDSPFLTTKLSPDSGELSANGKQLQDGIRCLLLAYKRLGNNKNKDNIIQESLWHLSEADLSSTSTSAMDVDSEQAATDSRSLARSIRTIVSIVAENMSQEGRSLFHDFASFMRLAIADAADQLGDSAHNTAEVLRDVDTDVQEGKRSELGIKRKADSEPDDADARAKFERAMDSTKEVGSKAIGVGQTAVAAGEDLANRTSTRLQDAFSQICDRAQADADYHKSIAAIFDIIEKWIHRTLDAAGDVNQDTSIDAFIDDPTPEQHLIKAIRGLRQFVERLASGRSLDGFFAALRVCGVDIQQDEAIRDWCDQFLAHLRRALDERGYVRSEEAQRRYDELRREWRALLDKDSEEGRKWKEDIKALRREATAFQSALDHDEDLTAVRRARARLGEDIENTLLTATKESTQTLMERAPWLWQDVFNVYLPQLAAAVKDIPIPRTEYKDDEIEFVLEDIDISTFSVLPGHAYIRNITDIDIKAPSPGNTDTAVGTLTRVYLQGLQIQLKEVSFYYNDKTATIGPAEFNGILEFTLPPQGVDVDIVVRSIPNSTAGQRERERRSGFIDIQRVDVKVSEDISLNVKQSNHQILVSVFRPVMLARLRDALQTVLREQLRAGLLALDAFAWDVSLRADVFADTGLPRGASVVAGVWSALGHMRRTGAHGPFAGWHATGTGVVKDAIDAGAQFAMGAEPQVLSGEKHGPKGTFAQSMEQRAEEAPDVDVEGAAADAQGVAKQAKETVKGKVREVKSWADTVSRKTEEERAREGWQSPAFDWV